MTQLLLKLLSRCIQWCIPDPRELWVSKPKVRKEELNSFNHQTQSFCASDMVNTASFVHRGHETIFCETTAVQSINVIIS